MEANKCMHKTLMPTQDAATRSHNFSEVTLGYTHDMAICEAQRCLHCKKKPCVSACPVGINIPGFIECVAQDDMEEAYTILSASTSLPAVCGRVCPQESQCEGKCVRANKGESVAIGRLERYVADWHREHRTKTYSTATPSNGRVAIIGSGPSGLTCAGDLRKLGYQVTVYEALHIPGGVLTYGIPEFRLPKQIVEQEINELISSGVKIVTNTVVGKTITVDELLAQGFDAVYIASGAGLPRFMGIPGESLKGVYSANEYLTRVNLMKAYLSESHTPVLVGRHVTVVGGGNVAMDAARCAKRLGAETVSIIYRRGMEELPARKEEVEHAQEEGICFRTLTNPVAVIGNERGFVQKMQCVEMTLGEPDESGRRRPAEKENSGFSIQTDCVIMALGTSPNPLIRSTTPGLDTNRYGCIVTKDEDGATSRKGVYAGGDAVSGAATVILAMGAGKKAAKAIDAYIRQEEQE